MKVLKQPSLVLCQEKCQFPAHAKMSYHFLNKEWHINIFGMLWNWLVPVLTYFIAAINSLSLKWNGFFIYANVLKS